MKKIYVILSFVITIIAASIIYIRMSKSDYLILGTSPTFMPFEYIVGEDGDEIVGFDIEIAKKIANDLGRELKIEVLNFEELIPSLEVGIIDMAICTMTITKERSEHVDFSVPYYADSQIIIVRADDKSFAEPTEATGLTLTLTKEDIGENKKLAARTGTTGSVAANLMAAGNKVLEMPSCKLIILELLDKKVDAVVVDHSVAKAFLNEYDNLKILPIEFEIEHYGVAVTKGNTKLLSSINTTINNLQASNEYEMLVENYINTRIEKDGASFIK